MDRAEKQNLRAGLLFTGPWILGFLAFCVYPLASSAYFSLSDHPGLSPAGFSVGRSCSNLFSDAVFWKALYNTLVFAAFAIPTGLGEALTLAVLLNFNVAGRSFFRMAIFLPSLMLAVLPAVFWLFNGRLGLLDAHPAKWGLIFVGVWGVGSAVVIYLSGPEDVPRHLYESAEIDGAGFWRKTVYITLRHESANRLKKIMIFTLLAGAGIVFLAPLAWMISNSIKPLWAPAFLAGAFNVFLLCRFFLTLPVEPSEAARLEGCSELQIFLGIILPQGKSALLAVALFQFMFTWNDLL